MCGIAGIFSSNISLEERKHKLDLMLQAQKHRGSDAIQQWHSNGCSLGHNRLSIIDLSAEANQPMFSSCGRYTIVFNGEVYNYFGIKKRVKTVF